MYLDIVLIDFLTPDGVLTSYKVRPKPERDSVVVDRLADIHPQRFSQDDTDIGGVRIYNASGCDVQRAVAMLRDFDANETERTFWFRFEHMGIPVGRVRDARHGMYNFMLCPGWRLRELWVVDPYDDEPNIQDKREFRYDVIWDADCETQMVEMELRSGRGSFSFIAAGQAALVAVAGGDAHYIEAEETDIGIRELKRPFILDQGGQDTLVDELARKADWLELKPNFFGLGVNLNQVVRDSIAYFQQKIRGR